MTSSSQHLGLFYIQLICLSWSFPILPTPSMKRTHPVLLIYLKEKRIILLRFFILYIVHIHIEMHSWLLMVTLLVTIQFITFWAWFWSCCVCQFVHGSKDLKLYGCICVHLVSFCYFSYYCTLKSPAEYVAFIQHNVNFHFGFGSWRLKTQNKIWKKNPHIVIFLIFFPLFYHPTIERDLYAWLFWLCFLLLFWKYK